MTVAVVLALPSVAVIVTSCSAPTVPAVPVKDTEVEAAGITTVAGTVNRLLLLDSVMVVGEVGTATVRTTVHVVVPPESIVAGVQAIDDSWAVEYTGMVTMLLRKSFCAMYIWAERSVVWVADN